MSCAAQGCHSLTQIQSDIAGWMNAVWEVLWGGSRGPGHVPGAGGEVLCGRTNRFLWFWHVLALRVVRVWLGKAWAGPGHSELGAGAAAQPHRQAEGTGLWRAAPSFQPVPLSLLSGAPGDRSSPGDEGAAVPLEEFLRQKLAWPGAPGGRSRTFCWESVECFGV